MFVINIPPCNLFDDEFFRSRGESTAGAAYGNFYRESAYAEIRFASRNSIKTRVCFRISRVRASTGASPHLANSTKQTDSERWYREQVLEDHPPSDDRYINRLRERERGGILYFVTSCLPSEVQRTNMESRNVILRINSLLAKWVFDWKLTFGRFPTKSSTFKSKYLDDSRFSQSLVKFFKKMP